MIVNMKDGRVIRVAWAHKHGTKKHPLPQGQEEGTDCVVYVRDEVDGEQADLELGFGRAVLGSKDHFSRDIGRRYSLARALQDANINHGCFTKAERYEIWEAYIKNTKNHKTVTMGELAP